MELKMKTQKESMRKASLMSPIMTVSSLISFSRSDFTG